MLFLPGCIVRCYVTGAGTDSSEQGRVAWALVKGATENALIRLFNQAYMFRPGFARTAGAAQRCGQRGASAESI